MRPRNVVIVGASLAGTRAAQQLRSDGYVGNITLVGEEPHAPYNRPPLSKQILTGAQHPGQIALPGLDHLDLSWRLGTRAISLDTDRSRIHLDDGEQLAYDALLIATGLRPRRFPGPGSSLQGVMTLRTLDDALQIKNALARRPRVAVIGGGFIGAEAAASARQSGAEVTIIEQSEGLMHGALGPELADWYTRLHRRHGVDVRTRISVASIEGQGRVEQLKLTDGTAVEADLVLVGLGGIPATNWLQTSGVPLNGGLQVTSNLRVPGFPQLFGAGDIANIRSEDGGFCRREHWATASHHGALAARTLLDITEGSVREGPPSFWTDQYDAKLQAIGTTTASDRRVILDGDLLGSRLLLGYLREERLVGAVSVNSRKALSAIRYAVVNHLAPEAVAQA